MISMISREVITKTISAYGRPLNLLNLTNNGKDKRKPFLFVCAVVVFLLPFFRAFLCHDPFCCGLLFVGALIVVVFILVFFVVVVFVDVDFAVKGFTEIITIIRQKNQELCEQYLNNISIYLFSPIHDDSSKKVSKN